MSYQINELERQLSEARTRIAGLEIERDGAYSLLREAADETAAVRAELDSLRDRVTALADYMAGVERSFSSRRVMQLIRTALVRGSDDEEKT